MQGDALLADLRAPIEDRTASMIDKALSLLETTLAQRRWLAAGYFMAADLNVAAVLSPTRAARLDLTQRANVRDWHARCYTRPAAVTVRSRFAP